MELLSEIDGDEMTFDETAHRLVDALEREREVAIKREAQLAMILDM
ncbi:hypothetical protein [Halovenus amylolytica]